MHKSQKERVLELLMKYPKGIYCNAFLNLIPKIPRYGARIFDLKNDGYKILTIKENKNKTLWRYVLQPKK